MSFDLIIKNGTVILENEARVVDIAVKDGKIAAIGQDLGDAKDVMDALSLIHIYCDVESIPEQELCFA